MTAKQRDPLLAIARVVITVAMGLSALVAAALTIAMPALLIGRERITIVLTGRGGRPIDGSVIAGIELALLLILATVAIVFLSLRLLRRIIDTVGAGDPFVPANADRLSQMGWLTVATQVLVIFTGAIGAWLQGRIA